MRTREDARIYKRLNVYDLDDGVGELLMAIDEELDDDDDESYGGSMKARPKKMT